MKRKVNMKWCCKCKHLIRSYYDDRCYALGKPSKVIAFGEKHYDIEIPENCPYVTEYLLSENQYEAQG